MKYLLIDYGIVDDTYLHFINTDGDKLVSNTRTLGGNKPLAELVEYLRDYEMPMIVSAGFPQVEDELIRNNFRVLRRS